MYNYVPRDQKIVEVSTPLPPPDDVELSLCVSVKRKWPNGSTITVGFLNGSPNLQLKTFNCASQWFEVSNLSLEGPVEASKANVRITFTGACGISKSKLGTLCLEGKDSQKPTMWLGLDESTTEDVFARTVLHEFGHVLGCLHEHQSPKACIEWKKDAVYHDYGLNEWDGKQVEINVLDKYESNETKSSEFDRRSVMLYPVAEDHTTNLFSSDWNNCLSETDKQFIGQVYPKESDQSSICSAPPPNGHPLPSRFFLVTFWEKACSYIRWCWLQFYYKARGLS
ncbi:hypothetical protein B7463_g9811, partial [Scytalidium lignicola]